MRMLASLLFSSRIQSFHSLLVLHTMPRLLYARR
nr:MAG TPA: hypothetical protein [Bacteriophage sp.]